MHPLRRRIENSKTLEALFGWLVAQYVRLCLHTIRWDRVGFEEIREAAAEGPVLLVMWHSRLFMAAAHLQEITTFTTLRDASPAGRVAGAMQTHFGMKPIGMSAKVSNAAASREVLKRLRDGTSVGLTGDGPKGPARELKPAPLDWARVAGVPVFLYAFSCTRFRRLGSWDRLLMPRPFGRGVAGLARWDRQVPRRADAETLAALRADLKAALDSHQERVDAMLGLDPGP